MKIEDIKPTLLSFLNQDDSYTSILIDGKWGCGKTTQVRECINEIDSKDIIYVSLFGVKNGDELSSCYHSVGKIAKIIGNAASIGLSAIPIVGPGISGSLSNVLDQYNDSKKIKKKKIFVFDDLERVDESMSLTSLLGFFNNLMLNDCKVLCMSALDEISDKAKRVDFDRFVEKAFDRVYHIDENPDEIFEKIFAKYEIKNVKEISKGFNGNIRLAKRTALLFKSADDKANSLKDDGHDFYQKHTKEELLNSAMLAIRILYVNHEDLSFNKDEQKSYQYMLLSEYSNYFGEKISLNYLKEFIDKKFVLEEFEGGSLYSLTRDLIHIEMFNNYDYFEQDCRIVSLNNGSGEDSLLNTSFYYLNDKDKRAYFDLLNASVKNKAVKIDSALIVKIGEICTYSSMAFSNDIIDLITDEIADQVLQGNTETFEKAKEHYFYVSSKKSGGINYVELIYNKAKTIIDDSERAIIEKEILNAYRSNNYKYLLDMYYDFAEGKLYSQRKIYASFTIKNDFFLPRLENSITHHQWSYCHELARYCKAADISDNLINYLKAYCKAFPDEESLKDKAFAMILYNIDPGFKLEDLDK